MGAVSFALRKESLQAGGLRSFTLIAALFKRQCFWYEGDRFENLRILISSGSEAFVSAKL